MSDQSLVPTPSDEEDDDGFAPIASSNDRVIVGSLLKFVDGQWTDMGIAVPPGTKLLAVATNKVLQRWHDQRVIETIDQKPLPDVELLNEAIPKEQWELGPNNEPRPPWQVTYVLYLLDPKICEKFTYANSTIGAKIAVTTLADKVTTMRKLRGANVVAEIELAAKPMTTRFGVKQRPEFRILKWVNLGPGGGAPALIEAPAQPKLPEVKPPTTKEALNDELPW
jgi:hypothetical protein